MTFYAGDTKIDIPTKVPTKANKLFNYWDYEGTQRYPGGDIAPAPDNDITLTAVWTDAEFYIEYDMQGGTPEIATQTVACETAGSVNISATVPTKDGFTFVNWSSTKGGFVNAGGSIDYTTADAGKTITLTANWVNAYFVSYSGDLAPTDATAYAAGATVTVKNVTGTKEGYEFGGYTSSLGGIVQPGDTFEMPASAVTLEAIWDEAAAGGASISVIFNDTWNKEEITVNDVPVPESGTVTAADVASISPEYWVSTTTEVTGVTEGDTITFDGSRLAQPIGETEEYETWVEGGTKFQVLTTPAGIDGGISSSGKYLVYNDIDLSSCSYGGLLLFSGVFDGGGNTLSNFSKSQTTSNAGFMKTISTGTIKHLTLDNASVYGKDKVGIICGTNSGTITDCHVTNSQVYPADNNVAGCGMSTTTYTSQKGKFVGGIAGASNGTIEYCSVNNSYIGRTKTATEVTGTGLNIGMIGGITGIGGIDSKTVSTSVTNCKVGSGGLANPSNETYTYIGGLLGYLASGGVVESCLNDNTYTGGYNIVGGMIGWSGGTMKQCLFANYQDVSAADSTNSPYIATNSSSTLSNNYIAGGTSNSNLTAGVDRKTDASCYGTLLQSGLGTVYWNYRDGDFPYLKSDGSGSGGGGGDTPSVTVTFIANLDGVENPPAKTIASGVSIQMPTLTGSKHFLGWSASSTATDATYNAGGNYSFTSTTTLYGVWTTGGLKYLPGIAPDNEYRTGMPADQEQQGNVVISSSIPKYIPVNASMSNPTAYSFSYWTKAGDSTKYYPGDTINVSGLVELTANWTTGCYAIRTVADYNTLESVVETVYDNCKRNYVLANDLSLAGSSTIIASNDIYYSGIFNGNGYTLSNLTITDGYNYTGMFAHLGNGAIVQYLNIDNFNLHCGMGWTNSYAAVVGANIDGYVYMNNVVISNSSADGATSGYNGIWSAYEDNFVTRNDHCQLINTVAGN